MTDALALKNGASAFCFFNVATALYVFHAKGAVSKQVAAATIHAVPNASAENAIHFGALSRAFRARLGLNQGSPEKLPGRDLICIDCPSIFCKTFRSSPKFAVVNSP